MKKIISVILAVMMVLLLFPNISLAASGTISTSGTYDISAYGNGATITINQGLTVSLTNSSGNTYYRDIQIVCGQGVTLTLDGVFIDVESGSAEVSPLSFTGSNNKLILKNGCTLLGTDYHPGIKVEAGTSLEISGTGSLSVRAGGSAAAIGSAYNNNAGTITISGGSITAQGGASGAGIGGCGTGSGGTINITGGTVTATGGYCSPGIGGGSGGSAGTINISGGRVDARGNQDGPGIGGYNGNGNITISGGYVTGNGDTYGAGIGGALNSSGGSIVITGGTVFGNGGIEGGAGIGGGYEGDGGTILISGDNITDEYAASGYINVCAAGSKGGAGIGGGFGGSAGSITISGSYIYAEKGETAPYDVGSGQNGTGGSLSLSDSGVLFLQNEACITPTTSTHTLKTTPVIPDFEAGGDKAYGFYLPAGCGTTAHVYLDESNLFDLTYDANGGNGTVPEAATQYEGTTITIADGSALVKDGKVFASWNSINTGLGDDYAAGETYTFLSDIVLHAIYKSSTPVSSVTLDSHEKSMTVGDTASLTATVLPEDASYSGITWSTSDDSVATVDQDGKITAVSVGNAAITAMAGGKYDTCNVTVDYVHVASVTLDCDSKAMNIGDVVTLHATVLPATAAYPTVTWTSSDQAVATVDASGKVTAVKAGTATITSAADGKVDTCDITVVPVHVASVSLNSHSERVFEGATLNLTASVLPNNASYPTVVWTSSNTSVATVDQNGKVTGIGVGCATIRAMADDISDICEVVVDAASYETYLKGCYIDSGNGITVDGIWDTWIEETYFDAILNPIINLKLPNCFSQCELQPYCYDSSSTYQILDGSQVVGNNAPVTVEILEPGIKTYTIKVTATSGKTRVYTVNIERKAAANQAEIYRLDWTDNNDDEVFIDLIADRFEYNTEVPYESQNSVLTAYPVDHGTTSKVYLNGKLIASDESASISFNEGINIVKVVLTSATNIQKTYTFNVYREYKDELLDLNVSMGSVISPILFDSDYMLSRIVSYDKDTLSYSVDLPNSAASVKLETYTYHDGTSIVVQKGATAIQHVEATSTTQGGYPISLSAGANTVTFTVTHPDAGSRTYTLNITRASSATANADLCNLFMSSIQIDGFSSNTITYDFARPYGVTIRPVVANMGATYKIFKDGALVSTNVPAECSTSTSAVITVKVTASNGSTTKIYTINFGNKSNIAELDSITISDYDGDTGYYRYIRTEDEVYDYSATTNYFDEKLRISASVDSMGHGETFSIYKGNLLIARQNISNGISTYVDLNVGLNTYKIVVTSENGLTKKEYTLNLTRPTVPDTHNASICAMNLWADENYDEIFTPDVLEYDINIGDYDFGVDYGAEFEVILQDINATCSVYLNDQLITTSNHCHVNALYFKEGLNTLTAVVTAADGVTQKTYTIRVQKAATDLLSLTIIAEPDQTEYRKGHQLELTGLLSAGRHASGYIEVLDADDVTITGYNANQLGSQTLTVSYGAFSDTFSVNVIQPVASVTLSKSSIGLLQGNSMTLIASVEPSDAEYPTVTWQSSNTAVATVDQSGKVKAIYPGTATITATADGVSSICEVTVVKKAVATVTLSSHAETITHHDTLTLTAAVLPGDATYPMVTWSSDNTSIATVDQTGKVTAVGIGEATITATADGVSDTCEVTVVKKAVTSVTLSSHAETITHHDTLTLTAAVLPNDATYPTVTWSSDNSSIATVDQTGKVTAVGIGEATITATADGVSSICEVTVVKKAVTSVTLSSHAETITHNDTLTLTAAVLPGNATYPTVTWSSDNTSIATVDQTGKVTAVGVGEATINATADGVSDTCEVTVVKAVTSVTLSSHAETITHHDTLTLAAAVLPDDATYSTVTWSSDNTSIATVDQTGKVTAVGIGEATISATADGVSDTCRITVEKKPVSSVSLNKSSETILAGSTLTLTATVSPADATYPQVTWSSSNETVATVDQTGKVTGKADGTVTITAMADGKSATCSVCVRAMFNVNAVANSAEWGIVSGGGTYALNAAVTLNATPYSGYRFVRWTENSAEVSRNASYTLTLFRDVSLVAEFTPLSRLGISCAKTDATLYGGADGSVSITASGGDSGSYEFSLNGGANWQSSGYFGGLAAGTYTAAVRDAAYPVNVATYSVTVGQPPSMGTVSASKIPSSANAGNAITIAAPAPPRGYTTISVTYSSTNPSVATVDSGGNVTFLAGGKATIITKVVSQTVDSKGRVKTNTTTVKKTVTVKQPVAAISLNMGSVTISRTQKVKLTPDIAPVTASNKKVTWTSSNSRIASVSSSGLVTGKAAGTVIITCKAQDGSGIVASCTVTVTPIYPSGVKISKTAISVKVGKTYTLKATVIPSNTDFKTVTWQSSNPAIATVDTKGKVRGIAPGTVTITVTTSNGYTASCIVTVK